MGVVAEDRPSARIVDVRAGFPPGLIVSGTEVVGKIDRYMRREGAPSAPADYTLLKTHTSTFCDRARLSCRCGIVSQLYFQYANNYLRI